MAYYAHITGWGMAVPEKVLTNDDLSRIVDTSDEWIVSRTGIRERRIAGPKDTTASLALAAAQAALEVADLSAAQLDLVIVATSTPEHTYPSTACIVQDALGAERAGAFDLSAACSGFIYALDMATQTIRSGAMRNVLVIGAETNSRILNWKDRGTCVLFGDGAGAFVVQRSETPGGVMNSLLRSDGSGGDALNIPAGGSKLPASLETVQANLHTIHMDGPEVYKFATRVMTSAVKAVAQQAGLKLEDIQMVIPHQANRRIIDVSARNLRLPSEKFFVNVDRYGNTSAASIPIAVCEAVAQQRIAPNSNLVLVGFGAGLTWGATLIKWDVTPKPRMSRWHQLLHQLSYQWARINSAARRGWRRLEVLLSPEDAEESQPPSSGQNKEHHS